METSIVICTYNRAQILQRTLESLKAMSAPPGLKWEVVVVDNNSTDGTRAVVEEFGRNSSLHTRYLFEPRQGLSHARNRGLQEAAGDVIAFTDDDVIVAGTWLEETMKAFEQYDAACVGGKVLLHSSLKFPSWWDRRLDTALGKFDMGDSLIVATETEPELIGIGANMSIRKWVFGKYGLFRTDLGRKGTLLTGSEETELIQRIRDDGQKVIYWPQSIVLHWPKTDRLSRSYFRRWYYWVGRWHYERDLHGQRKAVKILGVPRWKYRAALEDAFRAATSVVKLDRREEFYHELQLLLVTGYFVSAQKARFCPIHSQLPRNEQELRETA